MFEQKRLRQKIIVKIKFFFILIELPRCADFYYIII